MLLKYMAFLFPLLLSCQSELMKWCQGADKACNEIFIC